MSSHPRTLALLAAPLLAAALGGAGACRKPKPEAPPPKVMTLPSLEVSKDGKWLFTFVDPQGSFATTDDPGAIPETARRLVRVIDPSRAASERPDTVAVYVIDAAALLRAGKVQAQVMSREAFETGALAQLPPGESSELASATPPPAPAPPPDPSAAPAAAGAPVVTLYGTAWCGACRSARRYLSERKIPFADKDIEKDPAAAAELRGKAARLGVPADRVPILDVRGRLLIGFDKARLEALLGGAELMLRPLIVLGLLLAAGTAEAKIFDLYGGLRAGGMSGWGSASGAPDASDFFETTRGPGMGFEVGVELLNVNASINFTQLVDGGGFAGTMTQMLLGFDGELPIDGLRRPKTFLRLGGTAGFALGTHQPVDPPLDNAQVSDKGLVFQATVAVDRALARLLTVGLEAVGGYHHFLAGPLNAPRSSAKGMHLMIFLAARVHLDPFRR